MPTAKKTATEKSETPKKPAARKAAPKKIAAAKEVKQPVAAAAAEVEVVAAEPVVMADTAKTLAEGQYINAVGRRKSATAQTRLWTSGKGEITVNGKKFDEYFKVYELREALTAPLKAVGQDNVTVSLRVEGGGIRGQAEASRLGISRALIELNPGYRKTLKRLGFLTRDPREKERKKYGLKKARKAPQWAKR